MLHILQAIKTESGRRSENKAASLGMLALFQDEVKLLSFHSQIATSLVTRQYWGKSG